MDLKKNDTTPIGAKWRISRTRWVSFGEVIKTRMWLDTSGAERIPQKSIIRSVYKKQMLEYWATLCPTYLERAQRMRVYTKSSDNDD